MVTLWGESVMIEIEKGNTVAMKNVRIGDWNGRSLNSSYVPRDIYVNTIDHAEAKKVTTWFRQSAPEDIERRVKNLSQGRDGQGGTQQEDKYCTI